MIAHGCRERPRHQNRTPTMSTTAVSPSQVIFAETAHRNELPTIQLRKMPGQSHIFYYSCAKTHIFVVSACRQLNVVAAEFPLGRYHYLNTVRKALHHGVAVHLLSRSIYWSRILRFRGGVGGKGNTYQDTKCCG